MRRGRRWLLMALGLAPALVLLAHPLARASDVWGNVGPASPFGTAGLDGRYPLGNYGLDEHFTAVSAGVFSGVDVSGVPPMIAYFLAEALWQLTAWLANTLIDLFGFAFSLDLLNGSRATGGAGAIGPVSSAIHSIYANVFGGPWLVLGVAVAGCWAMWKALVQRRYAETAGSLALSLIYVGIALFFVFQPGQTIGAASTWTNEISGAFLSIAKNGSPGSQSQAKQAGADQLFGLLVFQPWAVLEFGGVDHCVKTGTGSSESDPVSVPVRPLPTEALRRLNAGEEASAEGKTCIEDARKYSSHFLRFGLGSDERNAEYEALNHGDATKLPEADPSRTSSSYKLSAADKPATDAMEEGGQYQRLLIAIVVFCAELGAFCLLGALSLGVILAQVLLLLWLAISPVALVAAAIPGRGHAFFKGWLSRLAGLALRKAAYSLALAILLAVCAALSAATSELGWLMSFGLQALLLWTVFVQRKTLTESLVGIATGPSAPGREGALQVVGLYYGARGAAGALRGVGRSARSAAHGTGRLLSGGARMLRGGGRPKGTASPPPRFGTSYSAPVGGGAPSLDAPGPTERVRAAGAGGEAESGRRARATPASSSRAPAAGAVSAKGTVGHPPRSGQEPGGKPKGKAGEEGPSAGRPSERKAQQAPLRADPVRKEAPQGSRAGLGEELRAERERARSSAERGRTADGPTEPAPMRRLSRRVRKGPRSEGGGER